jgi:uncharacterized delta-60 repeat protein
MKNPIRLTISALLLAVSNLSAATLYVSAASTNPAPPYATWATAATNIQDAVDAAAAGDEVVVTNGNYGTGGRAGYRVAVDKPLMLRSVNGPEVTAILGDQVPGTTNGDGQVTCVYLTNAASLCGFTLTHRATPQSPVWNAGGVACASTNAFVTNCMIVGNSMNPKFGQGGGAGGGTLSNCTLTGNSAGQGGGALGCTLYNCVLSSNLAYQYGGGAYGCTLFNCVLSGNWAMYAGGGGGAGNCTLYNCVLTGNSDQDGGGAAGCTLYNCTLTGNTSDSPFGPDGGGAAGCTLYNCIVCFNTNFGLEDDVALCALYYCCTTGLTNSGIANVVGNITGDPLFVDASSGDLRLQPASPCIDAGNIAYAPGPVDLDGNPRIVNGTVDIGAYEFQRPGYGPPVFVSQPASQTNDAGTTVVFRVLAGGSIPLNFQWRSDGVPLADGGNRAGTGTAALTLANVLSADAGGYSVVVSNGLGSVTSAVATLAVIDPAIAVQPVSQLGQPGQSVTFSVTAAGTAPLAYQWWKEGAALGGATGASLTLTNLQASDAGDYWVVVSNRYGSATSPVGLLTMNLVTLDSRFNPGANGGVCALAVQADGKILVAGTFSTLGGQTRNWIGRLNADGTVDPSFNPGAESAVISLALQADGKILVGGNFTTLGGQNRNGIGRLNADGTVDTSFNPGAGGGPGPSVDCLALQADGKILVGGYFTTLGGQNCNSIGRLNADGTAETMFNPGANTPVVSLAVQADGRILVGGEFTTLGGQSRSCIGRLNADGTLDTGFNPGPGGGPGPSVDSLALQADGKILVGGDFTALGGQSRSCIGRLNADGTVDTSFDPGAGGAVFPFVYSLALQADGEILVGGGFTTLGGQRRNYIGRLNADGTVDTSFDPGADFLVNSLALQADGKILVGGGFGMLGGQSRSCIGRLNNTAPATQSLTFDGSAITWLRGGASPEVWRTTFDFSTNGTDWASLGAGARIAGGWQLGSVSLPSASGTLRARGYVQYGGSASFVETDLVVSPPVLILVNDPGFGFSSNRFGFRFSGSAGQVVIVETSANLASWTPVATNTIGATPLYFSEPYSGNFPQRFYRLRTTTQ